MKVAFLIGSISRNAGGLTYAVSKIARGLTEQNVKVEVLSPKDEWANEDLPLWKPIIPRTFRIRGPKAFSYTPNMLKVLKEIKPDLVHIQGLWMYPSIAGMVWHHRTQLPYMISTHGMLDSWALANSRCKKRMASLIYENANLRGAACLHALCDSEANSLRDYGLMNPICIIPNGIDIPTQKAVKNDKCNQELPICRIKSEGFKVLLYLGRIHPKKGLSNLLKAWKAAANVYGSTSLNQQGWVLGIAGWDQDNHEMELKRLATELKIEWMDFSNHNSTICRAWSIAFLGPQFGNNKTVCYNECDAFILPSFSEGLPMVILEAWAMERPVLMTPQCNLGEGFKASVAIQIEPTVQSIQHGLHSLFAAAPASLSEIGMRGCEFVAKRFAWPKIVTEMKAVYEWILSKKLVPNCITFN